MANNQNLMDQYENLYFLHGNDHAGLVLVSDRLTNAADFHSWRRLVRMALNVRNKLGFVDGSIPRPQEDDRNFGAWSRCNDIVITWLMNSVSKKIGQSLLYISTAEGIWNSLLTRFKQDDAPRIFDIEQKLSKIEQGSADVSTYFTELVTLWEEHKNYVELPVCTCGKCECEAAVKWEKMQQRSRVTKFLMGLNESYEQIRRHILMLKPIPSIEEAFNIVAQNERQRSIKTITRVENVAFQATDTDNKENIYVAAYNGGISNQRPVCTHCGKTGHTIQRCYKLNGYPPGYKVNQSGPTGKGQLGQNGSFQARMQGLHPRMPGSLNNIQQRSQSQMQSGYYPGNGNAAVAHIYSDNEYYPVPTNDNVGANVQKDFTQRHVSTQHVQSLVSQFNNNNIKTQEQLVSQTDASSSGTITEKGAMIA